MSTSTLVHPGTPAIDLLAERASAIKLAEPGPSAEQIGAILSAAVTAADHGRIRPWRFVVIQGEGRKRFGDLLALVERDTKPHLSEEELDKARAKALRAPLIIALLCEADATNKVPVLEQQFAVAAAGAHLMLAAKALGFGTNWKTGTPAYHPIVRSGLGFGPDVSVVGFFYVGSEPRPSPLPRASIDAVVQYWAD
jgi:nitroreductase